MGDSEQLSWSATAQLLGCAVIVLMGCGGNRFSASPTDAQDAIRTGAEGALDAQILADAAPWPADDARVAEAAPRVADDARTTADAPWPADAHVSTADVPWPVDAAVSPADGQGTVEDGRSTADGPRPVDAGLIAQDGPRPAVDATAEVATATRLPCSAGSDWFDLSYWIAAAAYSRTLNVLLLLPKDDRALHILDPESCQETRIALPRVGVSLSLSPTGDQVVVGHDGAISVVALRTAKLVNTHRMPVPVGDVAFDQRGDIEINSRPNSEAYLPYLKVSSTTGTITTESKIDLGRLRITPDGLHLYWVADNFSTEDTIRRIDLDSGPRPLQNMYDGYQVCNDVFPTDDSRHLVTACGSVLRVSDDTTQDLTAEGVLDDVTKFAYADAMAASNRLVALQPDPSNITAPDLRVYDLQTFHKLGSIKLPLLSDGQSNPTTGQAPWGRYVFMRSDGSRYYIIGRRGPDPANANPDGVLKIDASALGSTDVRTIPVPFAGMWPDDRPPLVTVPVSMVPLTFDIVGAAYSRQLARLVVSSMKPNAAVYLVDPTSGMATLLANPASPSTVVLRQDGLAAGVVRSGGTTFIDLQTGTVTEEAGATVVGFGPTPEALVSSAGFATPYTDYLWHDQSAGTSRPGVYSTVGISGAGVVPGTHTFYLLDRDLPALERYDDNGIQTTTQSDPTLSTSMAPYSSCAGPFQITDDGGKLVVGCGAVFDLSPVQSQDRIYRGGMEKLRGVVQTAYAPERGRFVSVPGLVIGLRGYDVCNDRVVIHDDTWLNMGPNIAVGAMPGSSKSVVPLMVFVGQTPDQAIVLVESDEYPANHGVATLDLSGLAAP